MYLIDVDIEAIRPILSDFILNLDDKVVKVIKIKNLTNNTSNLILNNHFLKSYCSQNLQTVILELKPKWLYYYTDYCRNCTHNAFKGRGTKYCYNQLLMNPAHLELIFGECNIFPVKFKDAMHEYLRNDNNIFKILYDLHKKLTKNTTPISDIKSINDVNDEHLLLMTLRDVTCFIEWNSAENALHVR